MSEIHQEPQVVKPVTNATHTHEAPPRSGLFGRGPAMALGVVFAIAAIAAIVYGVRARVHAESELTKSTRAAAIADVNVTYPTAGTQNGELVLPGNTMAFTDTPIYARTSGYLKHWYKDIGAHVRQGELLATIETPELDQQLQAAQADLNTAEANLNLSKITSERYQGLLAKNAVSKQETDQATSDFAAKQTVVAAAEANVRRLKQLQGFEQVVAPFDGTITARNTDVGALITAGTAGGTPNELFHMAAVSRLRVFVAVPEVYANEIQNGDKVTLTQDATPDTKYVGTIVRNSNAIDQASRTLNVEVDVDNAKNKLLPGAYMFAHFKMSGKEQAMTIPSNALLFRSEGLRVGVVRGDKVELAQITIGHDFGTTVEVTSGLSTTDKVILDPSDSLESGQQVNVMSVKKAAKK